MKTIPYFLSAFLIVLALPSTLTAQLNDDPQIAELKSKVTQLESRFSELQADTQEYGVKIRRLDNISKHPFTEEAGALAFLFGIFCALWAQNTKRNAWIWFFMGLFLNVFIVLLLLQKNSQDIARNSIPRHILFPEN